MTLNNEQKRQIGRVLRMALEDESFEDFLERFDVTPEEAFIVLYESGLIDTEMFGEFLVE